MRFLLAASALVGAVSVARAEPRDLVSRPLGLAAGELEAHLVTELSLRRAAIAAPISFAPDVWYGIAPRWTLGLTHSNQSRGLLDDGASFCFRSREQFGCDHYNGSTLDVRWSWREGALAVAPRARFLVRDTDPWKPAIAGGALVRWTRGRFAITSDAYLQLGLTNRDRGNRAVLVIPIWLALQPTRRWLVALHTGWDSELAVARDGWRGPVGLATSVHVHSHLHVALEGGFRSLLGQQHDLRVRSLSLTLAWRP